ncbi:hypothetical protein ACLB2K_075912 [Fragaria x ananassa]
MVKAIRIHQLGEPEVLKWKDVEIGEPKEGEIRVKNKAIGFNFIDVYFRKGLYYKADTMPFIPGMEACGVVTVVGPGLTGRQHPSYLRVEPGHRVLVHAAAGGVGSLLCQWANALGAIVIGTVSTKEKAVQAKEDGCKDTFQGSLACLKTRGYMVSFGQASGRPDPVPLAALAAKSLFLTRLALFQYTATRDKLLMAAGEVFANVASGVLRIRVNHKYPLSHAAEAHADLENRRTSGSAVLIP